MMKIAVASQNRREITGHTGRCRRFWIYEIEDGAKVASKRLLEFGKDKTLHESSLHKPHPLDDIQVLISSGMGHGMRRRLAARGIETVVTHGQDPDASVTSWLNGTLEIIPVDAGDNHSDGHRHAGGCNCGNAASGLQ